MYIDNQVGDISLASIDDVLEQIETDMLSGDYVKWSFLHPCDCETVEITTLTSASDYLAFVHAVKDNVPSKLAGFALILYRVEISANGNEFELFGVQR